MKKNSLLLAAIIYITGAGSCKQFVDIAPGRGIIEKDKAFSSDITATSAIIGVYSEMYNNGNGFATGYRRCLNGVCGMSADELHHYNPQDAALAPFERNILKPDNAGITNLWKSMYTTIYFANNALEGLQQSETLTDSVKSQLKGEMLFVRAFAHFYLTNLFGNVPVILTSDYKANARALRKLQQEVYDQIIQDLSEASLLLKDAYPTEGRVRPNRGAAQALLARTFLYAGQWSEAETVATAVIANSQYQLLPAEEFDQIFVGSSKEAIWQIMHMDEGIGTHEAQTFHLHQRTPSSSRPYTLKAGLLNAFETGDLREQKWIDTSSIYIFPYKYQSYIGTPKEHSMVLRVAEQYLIRAEARARLGLLTGAGSAAEDIDAVRHRANLPPTTASTLPAIMTAIEQERRVELFTEWGHRWLDLKRWKRAIPVLSALKGDDWHDTDTLYPLPKVELERNPLLLPQNNGY